MALIPPIGSTGVFTIAPPFAADMLQNVVYSCEAVRKLSDIVEAGEDPFEVYYEPKLLDQTVYEADLANGVAIVSLRTGQNRWVYVPSSYVLSYANSGGVPYTVMGIGINLGPIPNDLDLSAVVLKVTDIVRDNLGVLPQVQLMAFSEQQQISHGDHGALTATREQLITDSTTDRAKLLQVTEHRDALLLRIQELEAYILANYPPP